MKQTALFIGLFLLIAPALASAQTPSCSAQGYTVVFVNGVFYTKDQAEEDNSTLQQYFNRQYGNTVDGQPVTFQLGYNPTHLAGAGDILQSFAQQFNSSITDFDLDTILMQIYPEVTTRKLLVVGHSQGAQYANEMYSYLLTHGEPKQAVGVYAVATPASFVAGGGKYITSTTDKVISAVSAAAAVAAQNGVPVSQPLLPNITLALSPSDEASEIGGHAFADDYLAGASTRITSDIGGELDALLPVDASATSDCFTPPSNDVSYQTQQVLFAVADPTATVLKVGVVSTYQVSALALNAAATLAEGAYQFVADAVTLAVSPPSKPQAVEKTNTIINKLYGSSLDGLSPQDRQELLGNSQGGAVALAVTPPKAPAAIGIVLGTSTMLSTSTSTNVTSQTSTSTSGSIFPASSNGPVLGVGGGNASSQSAVAASDSVIDTNLTDSDDVSVASDTASSTDADDVSGAADTASTTLDDDQASDTPLVIDNTPAASSTGSIISSQEDSSGTPSHYWHSDGSTGAFLVLDPNGGPGYSIGDIATTTTNVVGIHIKVQFNTDGAFNTLPRIPILYDESGTNPYACAQLGYSGYAYGSASDALALTNPLQYNDYNGKMVDMYFQCDPTPGHVQVYPNTSYRLYFYPISTADVSDIYVAMNAAGTAPFYEISDDGTYPQIEQ